MAPIQRGRCRRSFASSPATICCERQSPSSRAGALQEYLALWAGERSRLPFPSLDDALKLVRTRLVAPVAVRVREFVRIEAGRPGSSLVPPLGDPHYESCLPLRVIEGADAPSLPRPVRPHERELIGPNPQTNRLAAVSAVAGAIGPHLLAAEVPAVAVSVAWADDRGLRTNQRASGRAAAHRTGRDARDGSGPDRYQPVMRADDELPARASQNRSRPYDADSASVLAEAPIRMLVVAGLIVSTVGSAHGAAARSTRS